MKKTIISLLLFIFCSTTNAQLKVVSSGYVDKLIINEGFVVDKGATLVINKINIYD
jgi:hypothetical protein